MVYKKSSPVDLGIVVGLAFQTFVDELRAHLKERGFDDLGGAYGYVFRALDERPLHLTELAEGLGITNQGAVKIIDEMEQRGYVERKPDPEDARAKLLSLGPRGRSALAAARRFHAAYERRLGQALGEETVATARRVLEHMMGTTPTDGSPARHRAL